MDKIRQAIERSRAERERGESERQTEAMPSSQSAARSLRAGLPFTPDALGLANAQILSPTDSGDAANAIRLLRTIVLQRMHENHWHTVGVVSARHADGKSTLAGNIAAAIGADPRYSAMLVDLDVSAPWVGPTFGIPDCAGLAAHLLGEADLEDSTFAPIGMGRLEIIPLAPVDVAVDPAIVALPSLAVTFNRLKQRDDAIVIVDLPAVLDSDAALTAASLCDCLVFVVREGTTTRADLERGLGLLSAVPVLGTVVLDSLTAPHGGPARE